MKQTIKVGVAGCGYWGPNLIRNLRQSPDCQLKLLCDPSEQRLAHMRRLYPEVATTRQFDDLLNGADLDALVIATPVRYHYEMAMAGLRAGKHVFVEKPFTVTLEEADDLLAKAHTLKRKVVVGYILRHHPAWARFIAEARTLGKPLVMRMNLNQQSSGAEWEVHKRLMTSMSPIVDCGVHYVDIMCQMTQAEPVRVTAIGARLTDEIAADMYNYGQLQVVFADGSVGWYEAGWGPMMSETAFFVKDVIGPRGSVSIADKHDAGSADIDSHTKTSRLLRHDAATHTNASIDTSDDPGHQGLCDAEQRYVLKAVREDLDLTDHMNDAVNSLRIVLACDESVRTGAVVHLKTKEQ